MASITPWVHRYEMRDLMDDSIDLFRSLAMRLLLAGMLPYVLVAIYVAVMRIYVFPGNFLQDATLEALNKLWNSTEFWSYTSGLSLVWWIASSVGYLAQCRIAVRHALGDDITLRHAYFPFHKPFWSLLMVSTVYGFVLMVSMLVAAFVTAMIAGILSAVIAIIASEMIVGAIAIIVFLLVFDYLAIVLSVYFLAAPISLVYDHTGPFAAISQASRFAAGNVKSHGAACYTTTRVPLVVAGLVIALEYLLLIVMQQIAPGAGMLEFSTVLYIVLAAAFTALLACLQTLVYIDGKCRLDGLELRLLARQVGLGDEVDAVFHRNEKRPAIASTPYINMPNYAASPDATALISPPPAAGFPDYSAPPPAAETVTAAVAPPTFPDYSAPPPPPLTVVSDEAVAVAAVEVIPAGDAHDEEAADAS